MGFPVDGTSNRNRLTLAAGELANRIAQFGNPDIQLIENLTRLVHHIRTVKHFKHAELTAHALSTQEDVRAGIEIFTQRKVLVDGFYATPSRFHCRSKRYRLIIQQNLSAIGSIGSRDHLDER